VALGLRRRIRQISAAAKHRALEARRHAVLRARAVAERRLLEAARRTWSDDGEPEPLVSVTVATWNRGAILAERTIPAVLAQTHRNLELIVVGDCCDDDTAERLARIDDPRLRWVNLPERGSYPTDRFRRHCVAGSIPMMAARDLAQGNWISHLDDDEVYAPDHIESLLARARATDAELVWGRARYEIAPGEWRIEGSPDFATVDIPHSTVFMRSYLKLFREDMECWRLGLGADRHRLRRMRLAGVRAAFVDRIVTIGPLRPDTTQQWAAAEDREAQ
jgi:glycosyltransferase involved in cell wall biosynthesis